MASVVSFLKSKVQDTLTGWAATVAPALLTFENQEVTLEKHPLQTIFHQVASGQPPPALRGVPIQLCGAIATTRGGEDGDLKNAIEKVIARIFDTQTQDTKNAIYGTLWRMAGQPSGDPQWGEHHVKDDTERLIRALHRHHLLQIPGKTISVYSNLEKGATHLSHSFHLSRKNLERGQIGFLNGMGCTLDEAWNNARQISDRCLQGFNLHCVFSATVGIQWDSISAVLSQGGGVMPPVVHLLNQWQDFFEVHDERLLQLCTSRGAIEVHNALQLAPKELQQKIIVISIAPACIIPDEVAYKVVNLVIPEDLVVQMASNRHLMDKDYVKKLPMHEDSSDPHNLHGSSYRNALIPMVDRYLRTNDI